MHSTQTLHAAQETCISHLYTEICGVYQQLSHSEEEEVEPLLCTFVTIEKPVVVDTLVKAQASVGVISFHPQGQTFFFPLN